MKLKCLLLLLILSACKYERKVNTSFYYWKTIYKHNPTEDAYLNYFHTKALYVRIMDVDMDNAGQPAPVSPIIFKDSLPAASQIIPVVFVVNDVLMNLKHNQLNTLAAHIINFISAKVKQGGKQTFNQLQIDCDWTTTTRNNYFYLLNRIKSTAQMQGKIISATLRLHQLKNQKGSGIPPVNRVMLMCYNMGNLRRYGTQNSIIQLSELKKYLGDNLNQYPLKADIGLPLFSWAVAFRNKQYIGISKRIGLDSLHNQHYFQDQHNHLYRVLTDLPQYGLRLNDIIRWEDAPVPELQAIAKYLSANLDNNPVNILYFQLDETLLQTYPNARLETISNLLR